MNPYLSSKEETFREFASGENGLTSAEARKRLEADGPNKLKEAPKETNWQRFLEQLKDPMLIMLMIAAGVSAATNILQHESLTEVFIIILVVLLNAILGVIQESKAESAIEALQSMTAETCKVIRDGEHTIQPAQTLVPGDVILLEEGDSVPADARILETAHLRIDEASLTGESIPVNKTSDALSLPEGSKDIPLGDRKNMCYMGSIVVFGRGSAVVTATGMKTEMGQIADVLSSTTKEMTPLQKKLDELGRILSYIVLGICVFIFAFNLIFSGDFTLENILNTFMIAVSLAVAAIPEGLATVVTVVLSIGVTKMSQRNAVIRRLSAVETLGCAQVICSDKTGTLTQNKMKVVDHYGPVMLLAECMAQCNDAAVGKDHRAEGEPTEAALLNFALAEGYDKGTESIKEPRVDEAPFDSNRKMMSTIHSRGNTWIQYTKGAPEEVLRHCSCFIENDQILPLTSEKRKEILSANNQMADRALRVLAGAFRNWDAKPERDDPEWLEQEMTFIGLCGMIDPVRPEVLPAIGECRSAGIQPIMITGDHKETAAAIAAELGIISSISEVKTGAELNEISDEELRRDITKYHVYARVQPEHKVRIVKAWKDAGYVTAMTGDGVNDAPAIKTADIGVGMGITGTDVTKNVADMVLADDNFATIVNAIGEGRRIYDNIRKAILFLLSSNMAEVLGVFAATVMGFTLLEPIHLLFINLITDCFPALALGMERGEKGIMQRPPRKKSDSIFSGGLGGDALYQGIAITIITLASYILGHSLEAGHFEIPRGISPDGMTMAFMTLNMCEIFHSFNMRSQRNSVFRLGCQNKILWAAMAGALIIVTLVLKVLPVANAFGFTPISWKEYGISLFLGFLIIPIVETVKFFQRKAADKEK